MILLAILLAAMDAREGSGTSWRPDDAPMYAVHAMPGDWMVMLHWSVLAGYDDQWSAQGSRRATSVNWIMGMASHPLLGGEVELRSMLSLEPLTAGGPTQLPLLLQTGETYGGTPLHDRQHPHDLFMEVAAIWRRPLAGEVNLELYAAPSGEPALGPTAFMHRASSMVDPFPPIGHHWQDSTHISFPVLTAGLYTGALKLEASAFHGREPDENRWDLDFGALDSWSARLAANPSRALSLQVSYGYLHSPEALRPDESEHRFTASAQYAGGPLSATAVYGRNAAAVSTNSLLGELELDLDGGNTPFARLEWVQKPADELAVPGNAVYDVGMAVVGFAHRFEPIGPVSPLIGIAADVGLVPGSLEARYGTRTPAGLFVYLGLQPPRMQMHHMHHMEMQ
ncbi:MAG TPA: hypothetical protein VLW85_11655 [Myxococcales bacterium]|nr:hypothetical protein [Myxococcales bacterium]